MRFSSWTGVCEMKTGCFFSARGRGRISVSRSVPRFLLDRIPSYDRLAPPYWMHNRFEGDPDKWARCYRKVVLAKLDPHEVWRELHELTNGAEPILLCWEKAGEFCHRRIVAEWLAEAIGEAVPEAEFAPRPKAQLELFPAAA